jgi:hypothetical protein
MLQGRLGRAKRKVDLWGAAQTSKRGERLEMVCTATVTATSTAASTTAVAAAAVVVLLLLQYYCYCCCSLLLEDDVSAYTGRRRAATTTSNLYSNWLGWCWCIQRWSRVSSTPKTITKISKSNSDTSISDSCYCSATPLCWSVQ